MSRSWPFEEGRETEAGSGGEGLTPEDEEEQAQPLVVERDFSWMTEPGETGPGAIESPNRPTADPPRVEEPVVEEPVVAQPPPIEQPTQAHQMAPPQSSTYTPAASPVRSSLVSGSRTVRRTIRRVDPWSVLKLSFLFYASVALVLMFAAMLIFFAADATGIVGKLENFVQGIGWPDWQVRPIQLFRALLLIGVTNVVVWTAVNVFAAFLYNLVSDIVGGIQVTFSEREI